MATSITTPSSINADNCFDQYARLGWIVGSANLDWDSTAHKKCFRPHSKFCDEGAKTLRYDAKDRLITEEWQNAVFWLIMDAYGGNTGEPAEVVEETKEWIPQDLNKFREVLEEEFVLNPGDNSNDNFVAAKDIIAYIKGKSLNMSDTKIGRELGKLGLKSSTKKIGGKTLRVWDGIKHC
jgi:hypothetical protein